MLVHPHLWSVRLVRAPGRSEMQFLHEHKSTGLQVLDTIAWPLPLDELTEHRILSELYTGVVDFISVRA